MTALDSTKHCSRCDKTKSIGEFYANANGVQGVMPYCKACDNTRPRKPSQLKVNRMRARHRAVADLIDFHRDEFDALLAIRLAEATDEAEQLSAAPAAKEHFKAEPVRLRPGKPMPGEKLADRIDVARCPHCVKHHDRGHVCSECGATPTPAPAAVALRRQPAPVPSGVRARLGVDPAALAEFNAGTQRAARGGDRG